MGNEITAEKVEENVFVDEENFVSHLQQPINTDYSMFFSVFFSK